tara:strand:- start:3647 stop:3850 length:204 start_codon:yes stop_codon:yes gene_type:complete
MIVRIPRTPFVNPGDTVVINDEKCMTYGEKATVKNYNPKIAQVEVSFSPQWKGYYKLGQIRLIKQCL